MHVALWICQHKLSIVQRGVSYGVQKVARTSARTLIFVGGDLCQTITSVSIQHTVSSNIMWLQDIVLDFCDKEKTNQRLLRTAIQGWLKPRASSVKTITFK